jgi:hypothetical protein
MLTYIYFVKCPGCEDEPFDFFNEAKDFAMGCLSNKPIITQVEVNRNDFGECTDSADLGTVWSWEEMMKDVPAEPELTVLSKADTLSGDDCRDPEFDSLDNSLDSVPDNFRKPVPADMAVEDLVEAMEENEDTVECKWCEELFDKSECRYEVDLGWLCDRCQAAIKSRGETLTFREGCCSDSIDEFAESTKNTTWYCFFDDREIGTVDAESEEAALEKMMDKYPEYPYGTSDGCFYVEPVEDDASLTEAANTRDYVELEYENLIVPIVTRVIPATLEDPEDYEEEDFTYDFTYEIEADEVATAIWENFITEKDVADVPGGLETLEDDDAWQAFLETHFDALISKYYQQLLDYFEEDATEAAREKFQDEFNDRMLDPDDGDRRYDEWRDSGYLNESKAVKPFLEELEEPADYRKHLADCPECGAGQSFDHETGICINCGFNI